MRVLHVTILFIAIALIHLDSASPNRIKYIDFEQLVDQALKQSATYDNNDDDDDDDDRKRMIIKSKGLEQSKGRPTYDANKSGENRRMDVKNKKVKPSKEELLHDSFESWIDKLIDVETRRVEKSKDVPLHDFHKSTIKNHAIKSGERDDDDDDDDDDGKNSNKKNNNLSGALNNNNKPNSNTNSAPIGSDVSMIQVISGNIRDARDDNADKAKMVKEFYRKLLAQMEDQNNSIKTRGDRKKVTLKVFT